MGSPKKQLYIGIDLGNDAGFAVMTLAGVLVESGTWHNKPTADELPAARWIKFATNVRDLVKKYKGKYRVTVTYEFVPTRFQKGKHAAYVFGGWLAMLEIAAAEHRDVSWQPISIEDWKRALTGNGRAKKPAYIEAVNKRFGKNLRNKKGGDGEDEAAAIGVAYASVVLREREQRV